MNIYLYTVYAHKDTQTHCYFSLSFNIDTGCLATSSLGYSIVLFPVSLTVCHESFMVINFMITSILFE